MNECKPLDPGAHLEGVQAVDGGSEDHRAHRQWGGRGADVRARRNQGALGLDLTGLSAVLVQPVFRLGA